MKLPANKEKGKSSNFVKNKEVEILLMATQDNTKPDNDICYVDIGCSNHMSGCKSSFSHLNEDFHSTVMFDDSTVKVMGKGDIKIKTKNGLIGTISNVMYFPDLKSNLLSVGQLQEKGYKTLIQKGAYEIYSPTRGIIIAVIPMSSNPS